MIEELYNDYEKYASFYDIFNKDRNYERELRFILNLMKSKKRILDLGCGTGTHISILENLGYICDGIDKSESMVLLSKKKVKGNIYNVDILDYNVEKVYDGIIAMNFVFNHLKGYNEFEDVLSKYLNKLDKNGIMIIDLDNKKYDYDIYDKVDGNDRYIEAFYDKKTSMKIETFNFTIGLKTFIYEHEYFMYDIEKLKKILDKYNITYVMLTNFLKQNANENSERIHLIIRKN